MQTKNTNKKMQTKKCKTHKKQKMAKKPFFVFYDKIIFNLQYIMHHPNHDMLYLSKLF